MESECEVAVDLYYSIQLHAMQWIHVSCCARMEKSLWSFQLICSISSIALCIYTAKKYVRKTLFESSTKVRSIKWVQPCNLFIYILGTNNRLVRHVYLLRCIFCCSSSNQLANVLEFTNLFSFFIFCLAILLLLLAIHKFQRFENFKRADR